MPVSFIDADHMDSHSKGKNRKGQPTTHTSHGGRWQVVQGNVGKLSRQEEWTRFLGGSKAARRCGQQTFQAQEKP